MVFPNLRTPHFLHRKVILLNYTVLFNNTTEDYNRQNRDELQTSLEIQLCLLFSPVFFHKTRKFDFIVALGAGNE